MATMRPHVNSRRGVLVAAATIAALLAVAPASAQVEQPAASAVSQYVETVPSTSSVGQYVEAVPTGTGSSVPPATTVTPTTPDDVNSVLDRIAMSSTYGAPASGPAGAEDSASRMPDAADATSIGASFRSALGALSTASDARLLGLLAVVLVTTVVAIGLATRRGPI